MIPFPGWFFFRRLLSGRAHLRVSARAAMPTAAALAADPTTAARAARVRVPAREAA